MRVEIEAVRLMMSEVAEPVRARRGLLGMAAGLLVGVVIGGFVGSDTFRPGPAFAQPLRAVGAGGVMAFTGQLGKDVYGIIMIDVDAGTLWIYQLRPGSKLKLMAARSWMYDRYLEEYNCAPPTPSDVSNLVVGKQQPTKETKGAKELESAPGK